MRVLMISMDSSILSGSQDAPGDTQKRHIKYAAALRERYPNGDLTVLARVPRSHPTRPVQVTEALTIHPVPSRRATFPVSAWRLLRGLMDTQSFDLSTTQTPFDDGLVATWLRRRYGVPLNIQMRSTFLDVPQWTQERRLVYGLLNVLGKWVIQRADTIRVISEGEKRRLESLFPVLHGRIVNLHPLVNRDVFEKAIATSELGQVRNQLHVAGLDGVPFLLFVGRLSPQKNVPLLLEALAVMRRRHPGLALVIAGDGPLRKDLERQVERLSLQDAILWLGNLPLESLRGWFAAAKATMLPSLHEGNPKVVVESYLMGTPAVITPFIPGPELVKDGETGFVTRSFSDPVELGSKALRLASGSGLSKEMGEKGRTHVKNYLVPEDQYLTRLLDLWERTAQFRNAVA